jgi:glutamine amidotransferase
MNAGPLVGVVDYGMGNRRSVQKALERAGARVALTGEHSILARADALVIPGVGAFPRAMESLAGSGLDSLLRERVAAGTPLLGICLGMQLLFESSEEIELTRGLGLIPGRVVPLAAGDLPVPHIGWSEVRQERACPLTSALGGAARPFYHVHSLIARPDDSDDVVASAEYGERFATIVARGQVFGVQFHPEKSSRDGLRLLGGFVALAARHAAAAAA